MTSTQRPLPTGFDATATAADVLRGVDLTGTIHVVTGGYSGVGLEVTRALSCAGASVIVPARRPELAARETWGIDRVTVIDCNLASQASVAAATEAIAGVTARIDSVVGCAAVMACPLTRTEQGWELQLAVNHLGHAALIARLWPLLRAGSRIALVSSGAHWASGFRWDDPHFATGYEPWAAYGQSKTANILTAIHLDAIGKDAGVRAFALHPGLILTPLQRHLSRQDLMDIGWVDAAGRPVEPQLTTPAHGAATPVLAAASPLLAGIGGVYLEPVDVAPEASVAPHASSPTEAARLWEWTERLLGVTIGR